MGGGPEGRHNFRGLQKKSIHKVQIDSARSSQWSSTNPNTGGTCLGGCSAGDERMVGDVLAVETESDETSFWIVEVTQIAQILPLNYSTPAILDVKFEFPRLKQALEVRRFRTATTARGESPTRHNLNTIHLLGHFSFRATCFASEKLNFGALRCLHSE